MNHRLGVLVFGLLVIVASGHSVAYAAPTIDWTPSSLTQTIALGKSQTVIVTFKASQNESNVVVRVVPELQPYIQVSPSSFQTIQRGTTTTLTVMFSAAPNAIPKTYQGTIQLRSKATLARPLPVSIVVVPGPTGGPTAKDQILALEREGKLPLLDRSSDIPGPDTNFNGMRDDVENYIASLPLTSQQKKSVEQLAKGLQATLLINTADSSGLDNAVNNIHRAIQCLHLQFASGLDTSWLLTRIEGLTANTKERTMQYIKYNNALSGRVLPPLPSGNTCDN